MLITAQDMTPLDFHHFFLMFGCSLRLLVNLLFDLGGNLKQGNYQNYVETWQTDMRQAYDVASRSIQQLVARGKGYYVRKASAAVLLPGYCVPVGNLSGRESPGKLCSHLEEEIHVIQEHISIGPVYQVKPKHDRGKQRVLQWNLFLPCDVLPLSKQMRVSSKTNQLLSRALPQPENPGESS